MKKKCFFRIAGVMILLFAAGVSVYSTGGQGEPATAAEEGSFNPAGFPIVDNKITLKMMGSRAPYQAEWSKMDVFIAYEEMTNIHIEWDTVEHQARNERKNLVFASGDLPDVFIAMSLTPKEELTYGSQGLLLPLEDLIEEYAPETKGLFARYPEVEKAFTVPEGHIYSIPKVNALERASSFKYFINELWLEKLGLEYPTTYDGFYQVLKAFKERDPNENGKADEIPYSLLSSPNRFLPNHKLVRYSGSR